MQLQLELGKADAPYKEVIVEEAIAQFLANADQKFVDEILKRQKTRWQNFAIDPSKKYQSNIGAVFFWAYYLLIAPQFNHILIDCHPSLGLPNSLEQVDNTAIQEVESPVLEHDAIAIATKQVNNLTS